MRIILGNNISPEFTDSKKIELCIMAHCQPIILMLKRSGYYSLVTAYEQ